LPEYRQLPVDPARDDLGALQTFLPNIKNGDFMIYFQRFFIHLCTSSPAGFEPARHDFTKPAKTGVHPGADEVLNVHPDAGAGSARAGSETVTPSV